MIEMIDIKKRYINSDKNIIDGCTAIFDIGKRYALFGENGSGKTTFVKILGLLDKNFSGTYRIEGKDVLSMSGSDIARLRNEVFGFMFQDNKLLENESAYNNIFIPHIYSKKYRYFERKKRVIEIAEILGIEKLLKKRVFQMSGGEKHWHYGNLAFYRNTESTIFKTIEYYTFIIGDAPFGENTNAQPCLYSLHRLGINLLPTLRTLSIYHYGNTFVEITKQ